MCFICFFLNFYFRYQKKNLNFIYGSDIVSRQHDSTLLYLNNAYLKRNKNLCYQICAFRKVKSFQRELTGRSVNLTSLDTTDIFSCTYTWCFLYYLKCDVNLKIHKNYCYELW